ncbi:MAG TPA: hypothetical protein VG099_26765, partial [Gemmataceae bacterium]|nr:hypothetical protein [Gemmataceae bacterium]
MSFWTQLYQRWSRPSGRRSAGNRLSAWRPVLELLESRWLPTTFLVTTHGDSGAGSLRQAILDSNATPGSNVIDFAILSGPNPQTISPVSGLPAIQNNPVFIDGTSQPGYAGTPVIKLDGTNAGAASGLVFFIGNCTVSGLAIVNFQQDGILLDAGNDMIAGNYLGVDTDGNTPA